MLADAYTGAVVREAVDRHLQADRGHTVILREPRNAEAYALLNDLLGELPRRAKWAGEQPAPRLDPMVLLPAYRIRNREDLKLFGLALQVAAASRGLPPGPTRLLLEAAMVLGYNDLRHRPRRTLPGLLCVCQMRQSNDLQVVALSSVAPQRCLEGPEQFAAVLAARCADPFTGLGGLVWRGRGQQLDATLRLRAGRVRVYARYGRVRREALAEAVPWFAAGLEVHL